MGEKIFSLHFYYPIKQGGGGGGGIGDKYGCVTCVRDVLEKTERYCIMKRNNVFLECE